MAKDRIIGTYGRPGDGPLVIAIAGLHGNEPAGVNALERVFLYLRKYEIDFSGFFVGLAGNLPALDQGLRYIDEDLNRIWSPELITHAQSLSHAARNTEQRELVELIKLIEPELERSYSCKVLFDLHTTSAEGGMFSIVSRKPRHRAFASALHAPVLFDLNTSLSTTIGRFIDERKMIGFAYESGMHTDPASVDNHEAAIWLLLSKAGCINIGNIDVDTDPFHLRLITLSKDLPHYVQVIHRHGITPDDEFHMYPGFSNFHRVYKGEPLARDRNGEVLCPHSGLMLMPLYQNKGSDGFFIMRTLEEPPN
jgi:succinylglutamate desuccinylase